jgi:hypothetical protein
MEVGKMEQTKKVEHYLHAGDKSIYVGYTAWLMGDFLSQDFVTADHDENYDLVLMARTEVAPTQVVYLYELCKEDVGKCWYVVNHLKGDYDDVVYKPIPRIMKYSEAVMHYNVAIIELLGGI